MLPDDQKSLIKETVENFAAYKKVRKALAEGGSSGVCASWSTPNHWRPDVWNVDGCTLDTYTQSAEVACPAATGGGGNGLCLLFHGPSGVGKTMMANACASHVKKKVNADPLLISDRDSSPVGVYRPKQDTALLPHHLASKHQRWKMYLQVLLINFPSLGNNEAGETIRFIFREAKIHDAVRGS